MRLQKYLADAGICSRRKAENYILEGKVKVNGNVVTQLGTKVNGNDIVQFLDRQIYLENKKIYIAVNKPVNYVTTVKDQFGRNTVMDLISNIDIRLVPVGRLDYDTSGLLIMTNDGDIVYKLTHPKHNIEKTYIATVIGILNSQQISEFENGIYIDGFKTSKAKLEILSSNSSSSKLKITIHEGKNRQVRKMCEAIDHPVIHLKRISVGNIQLGNLAVGKYRYLNETEIDYLDKL